MQAQPLGGFFARVGALAQGWRRRRRAAARVAGLGPGERERLLADLGLSGADLSDLVAGEVRGSGLLDGMLARIGLDRRRLSALGILRDVERTCASCPDKPRCRRWLASQQGPAPCPDFCPNAETFAAVRATKLGRARH